MQFENVYYIKMGKKEQPEVEKYAYENKKVLIAYDQQTNMNEIVSIIKKEKDLNPESNSACADWESLHVKNYNKTGLVRTALRRFFLARPGVDCFCTFINNKFYYGIPSYAPKAISVNNEIEISGSTFRFRSIDNWIEISDFYHLSGMLQKLRAMRATLSRLADDDPDYEEAFQQQHIFESTKSGTLEKELIEPLMDSIKSYDATVPLSKDKLFSSLKTLICNLGPSDFEILVDIRFYAKGYRRCSELGGIQEAIDMEYLTPDKKHVEFCQVKSVISEGKLITVMNDIAPTLPNGSLCYIAHHVKEGNNISPAAKLANIMKNFDNGHKIEFIPLPLSEIINDVYKVPEAYIFLVGVYLGREKSIAWFQKNKLLLTNIFER